MAQKGMISMMKDGRVEALQIEVDGIKYTETRPGYYYKNVDGKQKRISKSEWEQAFEAHIAEAEDWDIEEEIEERKEVQNAKDAETEKAFNKKTKKAKKPAYKIESLWDGDTTIYSLYIKGELEGRYWSYEEAQKAGEEKTKKISKPRRSKDIAHESNGVTLTKKQVSFIKHIPDTCFYEHGLESTMWCDVLADEICGQFAGKPMTVGAMISTLREKNIIYVAVDKINGKKTKYFGFTELGKKIAKELGLN